MRTKALSSLGVGCRSEVTDSSSCESKSSGSAREEEGPSTGELSAGPTVSQQIRTPDSVCVEGGRASN